MFTKQSPLFKLLGFQGKLDLSWIFIAALVAWSLATVGPRSRHVDGVATPRIRRRYCSHNAMRRCR